MELMEHIKHDDVTPVIATIRSSQPKRTIIFLRCDGDNSNFHAVSTK